MQLKSLEISGFKSFADKTRIDFQDGMTGIVGPNGSGKSNIIEAIRWVLGEQAVKSLRGTKMADVIFAGSENRAPLNMAKVSITFDNSDHYLNSDYTELTITRKLFRNGDSEYLINNQSCRLKDITDLLIDTGMGKESFTIISQGRVEAIFNSKPEDRRAIIEDVAGVLKYKKDKQQTENKLAQTTDYLSRVTDIIAELEKQVEPLEQQASLATDYLDQKQKYDQYDRSRLVKQIEQTRTKKAVADRQFQQASKLFTQAKKTVHAGQIELDQNKNRQHQLQVAKDQLSEQNLDLTRKLENTQGKQGVDTERLHNQQARIADLQQQAKTQQQTEQQHQTEIVRLQSLIESQAAKIKQVSAQVAQIELLTSPAGKAKLSEQLEQLQDQYVDQMQQQATLRNTAKYLSKSQNQADGENNRTNTEIVKLEQQVQQQQKQVVELEHHVQEAETAANQQKSELDQQRAAFVKAQQAQDTHQQNWLDALGVVKKAQTQLEALTAMADNYQNFYAGVRSVLQHRQQFAGIRGAVSELITVPEQYTRAISIALGGQLQNVVCDNQATAKQAVQFLTQHRLGRATFLPIDRIHGNRLNEQHLQAVRQIDGVIGIGAELVSSDSDLASITDYLLGNVLIVRDIDVGIKVSKNSGLRTKLVTLAGEVINVSGSITGGATKHDDNGVLQQEQRRTKLAADVQTMQAALTDQEKLIDTGKARLTALTEQGQELRSKVDAQQAALLALQNQLSNEQAKTVTLKRQLKALQYAQQQQSDEQADYQTQSDQNQTALTQIAQSLTETDEQTTQLKQQIANYETNQADQASKLRDQREWLAATKQDHKQLQLNLENEQTGLVACQKQQQEIATGLQAIKNQADEQQLSHGQRQAQLTELNSQQKNVQKQLTANQIELADLEGLVNDAEQTQIRQQQLADAAGDDYRRSELQQTRLSSEIDHGLNDLSEKYQLTFEAASANLSDLSLADLQEQLKLLKMGLDEIGTVNLGAIDEYQRVSKRYDFLQGQASDLTASKEHLLTTMDEMDETVKTRFKQSFDQVADEFAKIFVQMFGGGQAKLILTDPEDLLTTGVDIMAQPPGKKFQRLSLLSGGERALTAITLLFAILAVRPVPFSILDEAEAALDDANVERFSQYLRNFQGATQFVVITHRKGTMMNANVLYGVTMEESGVSKMVSVSLDDVVA